MFETLAAKLAEAIMAGGFGYVLFLAASFVAFYFYKRTIELQNVINVLQNQRVEDTKVLTTLVERCNAALTGAAATNEMRDATLKQIVAALTEMQKAHETTTAMNEASREAFKDRAVAIQAGIESLSNYVRSK